MSKARAARAFRLFNSHTPSFKDKCTLSRFARVLHHEEYTVTHTANVMLINIALLCFVSAHMVRF